jgi:glucan-binding YG repeat protein
MIPWHVGLVQEMGYYWYFTGDEIYGGNIVVYGDVYAFRNNTDFDMVVGGIYTFDWMGHMCQYDGVVDVDGVLRYYENNRLMVDNGLTKVGDNFIYVNANGELVVGTEYYVPANDLGVAAGIYTFDENGILLNPIPSEKNGAFFENGAWYYYENGKIACNKGMMAYNGGYIYVRSNGILATGTYYVSNVSEEMSDLFYAGQKLVFDENGYVQPSKNGIYVVDGELQFFRDNHVQYNAGLVEVDGGWIYVRSNGVLATGKYWITNTNGAMEAGYYEFGADGYMIVSDIEDGIVEENGVLYYYLNGQKQLGLGLVQLENGSYIYVRTNGELAVGSYWITNNNGLLNEGMYVFGEDGILSVN